MLKPFLIAVSGFIVAFAGYALWHFCDDASRLSVSSKHQVAIPDPGKLSNSTRDSHQVTVASLLEERCRRDGVALAVVATRKNVPLVPAGFKAESQGPWTKVIRKLEDRYSLVAVYEKNQSELTQTPDRITQIGSYLYLGHDKSEIEALKMLADGTLEERSSALDQFGDDSQHAVSLLLSLQLHDEDPQIRIEATQKLQSYPSERVIAGLVKALGDEDEAVQSAARSSLVWIGNEQVLRALRAAAKSPTNKIADMATSILEENLERH